MGDNILSQPIKLDKNILTAEIFNNMKSEIHVEKFPEGELTTKKIDLFESNDEKTKFGVYSESAYSYTFTEPFGRNEYMHFIEGSVTLTSEDGTVTEISAGDSIMLPAQWKGTWSTPGYTKIYVSSGSL